MKLAASCDDKYCPSLVRLGVGTAAASKACAAVEAMKNAASRPATILKLQPTSFNG
jgi:hypothetical protein